jgi:hypothetical protein
MMRYHATAFSFFHNKKFHVALFHVKLFDGKKFPNHCASMTVISCPCAAKFGTRIEPT